MPHVRDFAVCTWLSIGWLALGMAAGDEQKAIVAAQVWPTSDNGTVRVPDADARTTVLIFVAHDCPMSNGYAPEIARLCKEFTTRGAAFRIVYAERALADRDAATHAKEFAFPCPAILDRELRLAARVGATMTPQAALLSPEGAVLYLGRIDDIYADYGKKRAQPAHRDLRDAIEAVLAGRAVPRPRTPTLGCHIDFDAPPRDRK